MVRQYWSQIRQPVRRNRAELYVLLTLVSFAVTVVVTRWFLELTGYPKIGNATLHVAHVLWGGLLLFVASLLPLVLANRPIYPLAAILSGIGVGLFIDEVGKFITQTNDYFFPAAAPLIYALFLLTVLVFLRVRRQPPSDPRSEMYRAMEEMSDVLDHDLEPHEHLTLVRRLRRIAQQTEAPQLARLAQHLLDFLNADTLAMVEAPSNRLQSVVLGIYWWTDHWLPRRRMQWLLGAGMLLVGLPGLVALGTLVALFFNPQAITEQVRQVVVTVGPNSASLLAPNDVAGSSLYLGLVALAGVPLIAAGICFWLGWDRAALRISYPTLLIGLTVVYLLLFYFEQFQAVTGALLSLVLLLGIINYRRRFVPRRTTRSAVTA